jgi:hypothetical protein
MTDNSELDNLFEEDKGISSEENKTNVSDNLALTGTVIMGLGWLGLIISVIVSMAFESGFPLLFGLFSLSSCWITYLLFQGLAKIIDLLTEIKDK